MAECSLTQGDLTHWPSVHVDQRFLQNCQGCGYIKYFTQTLPKKMKTSCLYKPANGTHPAAAR